MSDKRTTPDPAESARRRKRAAPTIDLTATEVPAAGYEEPPSEPPPEGPAQPATDNEPESCAQDRDNERGWFQAVRSVECAGAHRRIYRCGRRSDRSVRALVCRRGARPICPVHRVRARRS